MINILNHISYTFIYYIIYHLSVSIYEISDYNPCLWYPAVTLPNWWCYLVPSLQGHQLELGHLLNRSQAISSVLNVTLQWNVTKTCRCGRRSELFGRFVMHLCLLPTKLHPWHVVIQKSILVLRAEAVLSAAWMSQPEEELTCNSLPNLRNLLQNPTLNALVWWKKLIWFAVYSTSETPEIEAPSNMTDWQRCSWDPSNQNLTCLSKVPGARCPCHSLEVHSMKVMNTSLKTTTLHRVMEIFRPFHQPAS